MEDGDGISDNGEIKLGLDPLKIKTDGKTSDAERIFEQKLDTDSETFRVINSEENPYRLSVSAKASGYIGESVNANISSYSNYLQNEAVAGDIIDIDYADSFKIETLTISFTVSENAADYYIFRYFEDVNMLLPVETQYDGNRVYTEAAEDGTYCIVDMDKWIENTAETTEVQSTAAVYNAVCASSEAKSLESLEVYFLMYIRSSSVDSARSSVANASRAIIDYCNSTGRDVRLYFAAYTGATVVSNETGNSYADNASTDEEIQEMLSRTGSATGSLDTTDFNYSLTRALKKSLLEISGTNENSKKYCFVVDVNFEPKSASNVAVVDEMKSYGVDFSFICNDYNSNIANYESLSSDGTHIRWTPDFSEVITDKVLGAVVTYNVNTGLCNKIPYNEALITSEWKDIYEKFYSGKLSIDEIKKLGLPDTDGDGNPDCLEIFMKYISFDENGNIILPTYDELARDAMGNSRFGLKGLDELVSIMKKKGMNISDLRILPLISNPAFEDSDFDGIPDSTDERPSEEDIISVDDTIIDDSRVFESDYKTISNNAIDGNGIASSHSGDKKNNIIKYARLIRADGKATSKFYIEPDDNNDYLITVDTGKYDDCQIKVSYEKGIIFKKDVAVSDIELDEGIEEKEQNGNVMHSRKAYSLEKGKKYKVVVTIASTDFAANNYSVSFEQNNWVYAPNGGYDFTKINDFMQTETVYIDDDSLFSIIKEARLELKGEDIISDTIDEYLDRKDTYDKLYNSAYSDVCDLIKMQENNTMGLDSVIGDIGNGASLAGLGSCIALVLWPNSNAGVIVTLLNGVGTGATVVGGFTALYAIVSSNSDTPTQSLAYALCDGKYNLATHTTKSTYNEIDKNFNVSITNYSGWNDSHFINKYNADNSRKTYIKPFRDNKIYIR